MWLCRRLAVVARLSPKPLQKHVRRLGWNIGANLVELVCRETEKNGVVPDADGLAPPVLKLPQRRKA
jgi:hypothetical protein